MKKRILFILVCWICLSGAAQNKENTLSVLQFNIWQEGTQVKGGYEAIADQIIASGADLVALSEVRNYNNTRFCDRIVESLRQKGATFYSYLSYDSGILSCYPITDSVTIFPLHNDHGSMYKAVVNAKGREIAFYTAHLDYLNCTYYDVKGYNGSTWKKRPPLTDMDSILINNTASRRDDAIQAFLAEAAKDRAQNRIVIIGGDFNEPSLLDWTEATKHLYDRQGLIVPWTVSKMLLDAGYKDAYRVNYPDPLKNPGITYPADCPGAPVNKLTWAPESDERERIDFIYYYPDSALQVKDAVVWGPQGSIVHSQRVKETERTEIGSGVWPTDHKAVLVKFSYSLPLSTLLAQNYKLPLRNTIQVEINDTNEQIIEKAAHIVPTANQWAALQNEFIAFIHFGPNTFTQVEWGNGYENPKVFDLKQVNTDQWCEAMKTAGMKMAVLTVKHHDGFVLWQSRYTTHGVMSTPFREGKGDILKDLSESCRKYGIKLGIYLSPADLYQIESPEGLYGNLSPYTQRTIPREVPGRPFKNHTRFQFKVDDYNEYFLNQLFELLTEYGPIHEVWFDGAHPKRKGNQQYNYTAWRELIRTLAPKAVVFGKEDIRWCGNEGGNTRATEWNVIPYAENPNTMNNFADLTNNVLGSREVLQAFPKPYYLHYQPAETNTSIRAGWFYSNDETQKVRSADDVFDIYERSVGGNSIFMLNIPPNREGYFPEKDVNVLREVGQRIRETYGTDLLHNAQGPKEVLDGKITTYTLLSKEPKEIVLIMPKPITLNRLAISESILTHGERVEQHAVDAYIDGRWQEVAQATNIGHKRILRFPKVTTDRLRIRILASRLSPAISNISAHYYHTRPPMLDAHRDIEGYVSLEPMRPVFHWNTTQQNSAKNLNGGYKVYYTTDGTEPTLSSTEYKEPFHIENTELKAISYLNGEQGTLYSEQFGLVKQNWKRLAVSSETEKYPAASAFDENPHSYWLSKDESIPHFVSIDLGKAQILNGFAYTPQQRNAEGMIEEGVFLISDEGHIWREVEHFRFGNLVNDPTKRSHYFKHPVTARYVRLEANRIAGNGKVASIAELDIFTETIDNLHSANSQ